MLTLWVAFCHDAMPQLHPYSVCRVRLQLPTVMCAELMLPERAVAKLLQFITHHLQQMQKCEPANLVVLAVLPDDPCD